MCRFQTLYEIFQELNRVGSGAGATAERGPVLLLLGGGMAAGKSTVREVIGHDDFWSKVRGPFGTYLSTSLCLLDHKVKPEQTAAQCCCFWAAAWLPA